MIDLLRGLLKDRAREFYLTALLLWLVPALLLAALGMVYLWQAGWFWWFSGVVLLLTAMSWLARYARSQSARPPAADVQRLDPRPDWSSRDKQVWQEAVAHIEASRLVDTPWDDIPRAALDQLSFVARAYHGDDRDAEYAFSVPELLLMLETWSREYRARVIEIVPLSREVRISTLMGLSRKSRRAWQVYEYSSPAIRVLRGAWNPVAAVLGEITSQFASRIYSDLNRQVQNNMKLVLFEQVTRVAIDLYSGRLRLSEAELSIYRASLDNPEEQRIVPLSVILVGQINAGKSSLVNALKAQCAAEIDVLPTTAGCRYHHMQLADDLEIYLIDTPGLDGREETFEAVMREATRADLLLWVSQANQPAKALDREMMNRWNAHLESNLNRKKPPVLLVTTHNDLLKPSWAWDPPYDLSQSGDEVVASIMEALRFTQEQIGLPADNAAVPVALPPDSDAWNLNVLKELLLSINDQARAAQLNRQRLEAIDRASIASRILQQSTALVRTGVRLARK
ncbi:MAG: GTPase [Gammaproteobacteria bacterium]|nr:GTPase [Gammaproteobacteria bacterium]